MKPRPGRLKVKPSQPTAEAAQAIIVALHELGWSFKQIAPIVGRAPKTVAWLYANGKHARKIRERIKDRIADNIALYKSYLLLEQDVNHSQSGTLYRRTLAACTGCAVDDGGVWVRILPQSATARYPRLLIGQSEAELYAVVQDSPEDGLHPAKCPVCGAVSVNLTDNVLPKHD